MQDAEQQCHRRKNTLPRSLPPVLTCPCLSVLLSSWRKMPRSLHAASFIFSFQPLSHWVDRERKEDRWMDERTGWPVLIGLVVAWQRVLEQPPPPPMFSRCHFIKRNLPCRKWHSRANLKININWVFFPPMEPPVAVKCLVMDLTAEWRYLTRRLES